MKKRKIKRTLPGDAVKKPETIDMMLRVDQAGEYGAQRIYQGQIAVLGHDPKLKKVLQHMADQEAVHLEFFDQELVRRNIRPTALSPLWHVAGYALGAFTARLGPEAAMACTVAVEDVISEHYDEQLDTLPKSEKKLRDKIARFKAEEEEHHAIGLKHHAEKAPGYEALTQMIKAGSRAAIWLAKRV